MYVRIAKLGNSLALRIPADYVRLLGLKEGDRVQVTLTADGGINVCAAKWNRRAFAQELEAMRQAMPMTESVVEELRRRARY
ncbi:AbrB/MazE/SpoVT family DNA-binding domain-containing protein [Cupriavidus basilensis]|uniref:AbrB/MazE/SpoVT family DNA-binding domain-containing protein n=1 Tax=Cupriavidus basilensis TaxID=68895 RepID=UPI0005B77CF1|nr:AbrB/MazE/SpoVT family DNA-binding domain-containing protein [Cupriavidus basilensis]